MAEAIKIDGLAEFARNLGKIDSDLPKAMRVALNEAAQVVVNFGQARVPRRSGRARSTIRARSTRTAVRVAAGGRKAPYYPWLDFGGRVGRNRSVKRPFIGEGRYLYPALSERGQAIYDALEHALVTLVDNAGIEVS